MIAMKMLLIEDQPLLRAMIVRLINGMTSKIVEAETLEEAMTACHNEEFDVIMFDLVLPDSIAERSLSMIAEMKRLANAHVLVVSGWPDPGLKQKALDAGADSFLEKDVAFASKSRAFLMALYAAVMKDRNPHSGDSFMDHVQMLERLVHSFA